MRVAGILARLVPPTHSSPPVMRSSRRSSLVIVVLPAPLSPMMKTNSPSPIFRFRLSSATFPPGYRLVTFLNSIILYPRMPTKIRQIWCGRMPPGSGERSPHYARIAGMRLAHSHNPKAYQNLTGFEVRYFLTIKATLNVIACSNSRRSRPVILRIFSRR